MSRMKLLLVILPSDDKDEDDGDDGNDNNDDYGDHDDDHYNGDDENDIDNTDDDNLYVDEMPLERFPPFCEQGIVGNGSICTGKKTKTDMIKLCNFSTMHLLEF